GTDALDAILRPPASRLAMVAHRPDGRQRAAGAVVRLSADRGAARPSECGRVVAAVRAEVLQPLADRAVRHRTEIRPRPGLRRLLARADGRRPADVWGGRAARRPRADRRGAAARGRPPVVAGPA